MSLNSLLRLFRERTLDGLGRQLGHRCMLEVAVR